MAGKRYREDSKKVEETKQYTLDQALDILDGFSHAKFDETVDIAVRLGVDPKQSDQAVRGAVALPHGIGRSVRVAVFAKGEKAKEAKDAGAETVGAEDLADRILGGWLDFDKAIATPDLMGIVGKLGKVLGPRGMMPNPKLGTVTQDVAKAVTETKAGKVEFRIDKAGIVHALVGKRSFGKEKLRENISVFLDAVIKVKPASTKGVYLKSIALSGTMTPSVGLDTSLFVSNERRDM